MKNVVLYPGCLVLYRFSEYEYTSKLLLQQLGMNPVTLDKNVCCGAYVQGTTENWEYLAAYNMALAEAQGLEIITLCGGCTNTFKRLKHECNHNPEKLKQVNIKLKKMGLEFNNQVRVRHLLEVLKDNYDQIAQQLSKEVKLNIAIMNPCQIYRPSEIMQFDNPDQPQNMQKLVSLTGANVIHYLQEHECCGSSLANVNIEIAHTLGSVRLKELEKLETDLVITACGNCHLLLDRMQREYHQGRQIPIMFVSQLIGLALGWSQRDLRIKNALLRRVIKNV
ncbi:MAG TPA: CoB--CoM heterodisulfide reductase iron-sulfur subunit B family protein [Syntrophomonadaceae bacterium]|nr:CoB--CoM heterodisulfide reductase iron-sulfur subunit B family protein [Syntrophomonadaceae bacterium]